MPLTSTPTQWRSSVALQVSNLALTSICVRYILWRDFANGCPNVLDPENALLPYASRNWFVHLKQALPENTSEIWADVRQICDTNTGNFQSWARLSRQGCKPIGSLDRAKHPLAVAACIGLDSLVDKIPQDGIIKEEGIESALSVAGYLNNSTMMQKILTAQATVNASSTLNWVVKGRAEECLKVLVEADAVTGDQALQAYEQAMDSCFDGGIEILQASSMDGIIDDPRRSEILIRVLHSANRSFLAVLLQQGLSPNGDANSYTTPLAWAASWAKADIVSVLLKHGADINLAGGDGRTPISRALECELGTPTEVELDLERLKARDATIALLLQAGASTVGLTAVEQSALTQFQERCRERDNSANQRLRGSRYNHTVGLSVTTVEGATERVV
ncbi:hypothetical protein BDV19DRAFT_385333 [Aspergillus venezuelensis]